MTDLPYIEKIISGTVAQCNKLAREYQQRGFVIVKQTRWSDKKYTYVLRFTK